MTDLPAEPLVFAADFNVRGVRIDLASVLDNPRFTAQKPYRNGVTVYKRSIWGGNGFGTDVTRVAVRTRLDGAPEVVALYESTQTHMLARVLGQYDMLSDGEMVGHGANRRRVVTKTALNKWTEAVKAL